jgi:PKD repeat protein
MKKIAVFLLSLNSFGFAALAQVNLQPAIKAYLSENSDELGLELTDFQAITITDQNVSRTSGVKHVYVAQEIDGVILKNGVANFAIDPEGNIVHSGVRLISNLDKKVVLSNPTVSAAEAISNAKSAIGMDGEAGGFLKETETGRLNFDRGTLAGEDIQVYKAYWALRNEADEVKLVWIVSLYQPDGKHWWQSLIDASTGEEVKRLDWVVSCAFPEHGSEAHNCSAHGSAAPEDFSPPPAGGPASYNVFPMPVESPNHGIRTIETDPADPFASPYGWHDTNGQFGEEYTITRGNNVFAYDDIDDNNSPGSSPDGGSSLVFDYPYSGSNSPTQNLNAAITNVFFWNNIMHDVWYQYGFDEVSGNFQANNYGNGGNDDDYVLAEAQDGSGTNNANFATPDDGFNPRMQMYLWTGGTSLGSFLDINAPSGIAGPYNSTEATFGPGLPATPITADVILVTDGTAPVNDGCEALTNATQLSGKIALIDRGGCNFTTKVENAQNAGAVAVIIANNEAGSPFQMGGTSNIVNIPSVMISQTDGNTIKEQLLLGGAVNATISDGGSPSQFRDSDFDNGIIAHEYGHGISNRLTGGPSNSGCLQNAEQMGEGWSDWFGLMLTLEPGDAGSDSRGIGTYAGGQSTIATGIRPAPYSTDFGLNPYTYGDSNDGNNISQPHGIGFVYATALWDMTWALIDYYGGVPDPDVYGGSGGNNIAMQLVIESLKLQPCGPGMIDGRDAILQADQILYGGEHECIIWNAFANRGFGVSASQGSGDNRSDQVEAFDIPQACQAPTTSPNAGFLASTYFTCNPEVSFEDQSTEIPTSWDWSFGDGGTSTSPNPIHTFTSEGAFNVELTVSNPFGSSTETQVVVIDLPDVPQVSDISVCIGSSGDLVASSTGTSIWRDNTGAVILEGDILSLASITSAQSYTVENLVAPALGNAGPINNNFGTGGIHSSAYHGAINFTAIQGLEIVSAYVVADGAGPRTFTLAQGENNDGTPPNPFIQQVTVDLVDGPQRVDLNMIVEDAGDYNLGANNVDLYRNDSGPSFPYTLAGVMTLNSSSAGTGQFDYYYYFYDLEIREIPCVSLPVGATATPVAADFSYVNNGGTVAFTDLSTNASSWFWDFGDGNTSTQQNPTHTYSPAGNYTATLTVNGQTGCEVEYAIDMLVGVNQQQIQQSITLIPNPAADEVTLWFDQGLTESSRLDIYAADGRLVKSMTLSQGLNQARVSTVNFENAIYWLVVNTGSENPIRKRLMVLR